MPGEWKRAIWTYDAVGLGHTATSIVNAMHTFLASCGWERAVWDTTADRMYIRSDRYDIVFENDAVGAAGNQNITIVDANTRITLGAHMVGGTSTVKAKGRIRFDVRDAFDGATVTLNDGVNPTKTFEIEAGNAAARGQIGFLAQPADGNTVVLNDGVNPAITFEFDSNNSVVQTSTLRKVVIGANIGVLMINLIAAINDVAITLAITASVGLTDSVLLTNDAGGAAGNQNVTTVGANMYPVHMTGGGGGVGVTGGNVSVTRGATLEDTITNFVTAVNGAANLNITARWANRWTFNGDGPWQHCGIHLFNDTANSRIVLRCFLEKLSKIGNYRSTNTAHQILITYSNTAPNVFTFFGGEDGFFGECGRDGLKVNLAHWFICSWVTVPEMYGTDDARIGWATMGACLDLFGNCKVTGDRNFRVVDYVQNNRNYSTYLIPHLVRGSTLIASGGNGPFDQNTQADDQRMGIGSLDSVFQADITQSDSDASMAALKFNFALLRSPRDGRYRISPMMCFQHWQSRNHCVANSGSVSNAIGATWIGYYRDPRTVRRVPRFSVVDATLIPFTNVVDQRTSVEYYLSQIQDSGRTCNIGVEWTTDVVSIPASP